MEDAKKAYDTVITDIHMPSFVSVLLKRKIKGLLRLCRPLDT